MRQNPRDGGTCCEQRAALPDTEHGAPGATGPAFGDENWGSREVLLPFLLLATASVLPACATYDRHGLEPALAAQIEKTAVHHELNLSPERENRILALDSEHVTEKDIQETLASAPAPRIINIHGGISPVQRSMISFAHFLIAMGYPESSIRNPSDGTYTFSCYESSDQIAGFIVWYYEKEGLRPMIIGHSQGGMQTIKVLDKLAGHSFTQPSVWNPLTWEDEHKHDFTDPLTGQSRPVVGFQVPYATALGAGGLTRFLPNQWDMCGRLRSVPDSVEEFTGFYKGKDLLGGDFLGNGPANLYKANGTARVRNIELPADYEHGKIPVTEHLAKDPQVRQRVNNYTPANRQELERDPNIMDPELLHILWAADVWYSIKKHWVLELQRNIRVRRVSGPTLTSPSGRGLSSPQQSSTTETFAPAFKPTDPSDRAANRKVRALASPYVE